MEVLSVGFLSLVWQFLEEAPSSSDFSEEEDEELLKEDKQLFSLALACALAAVFFFGVEVFFGLCEWSLMEVPSLLLLFCRLGRSGHGTSTTGTLLFLVTALSSLLEPLCSGVVVVANFASTMGKASVI